MLVKGIITEDFVNYKKVCMTIEFPYCSFKCDKEYGCQICQNLDLTVAPNLEIPIDRIVLLYSENPITEAVCFQGLEPFDSAEIFELIGRIRTVSEDDIVIYTGYTEEEVEQLGFYKKLIRYNNIIIKYGRYVPKQIPHYDSVLGVNLASDNQYARRIS